MATLYRLPCDCRKPEFIFQTMLLTLLLAAMPLQERPALPSPGDDGTATRGEGSCAPSSDTITVCGDASQAGFRVAPLPDARYRQKPLRPVLAIPGGGRAVAYAEQRGVGGVSVPAAMVTATIPLGAKPKQKK